MTGRAQPHSTDPPAPERAQSKATEIGATACARIRISTVSEKTTMEHAPAQPTPRRAGRRRPKSERGRRPWRHRAAAP
eukprot:15444678-Alexandrium_andersonii.AAC.1